MQDDNIDDADNAQAWAYQQELEHQQFLFESGCLCPDYKEIKKYGDKHGI